MKTIHDEDQGVKPRRRGRPPTVPDTLLRYVAAVLSGYPFRFADLPSAVGVPRATLHRWLTRATAAGEIEVHRLNHAVVWHVLYRNDAAETLRRRPDFDTVARHNPVGAASLAIKQANAAQYATREPSIINQTDHDGNHQTGIRIRHENRLKPASDEPSIINTPVLDNDCQANALESAPREPSIIIQGDSESTPVECYRVPARVRVRDRIRSVTLPFSYYVRKDADPAKLGHASSPSVRHVDNQPVIPKPAAPVKVKPVTGAPVGLTTSRHGDTLAIPHRRRRDNRAPSQRADTMTTAQAKRTGEPTGCPVDADTLAFAVRASEAYDEFRRQRTQTHYRSLPATSPWGGKWWRVFATLASEARQSKIDPRELVLAAFELIKDHQGKPFPPPWYLTPVVVKRCYTAWIDALRAESPTGDAGMREAWVLERRRGTLEAYRLDFHAVRSAQRWWCLASQRGQSLETFLAVHVRTVSSWWLVMQSWWQERRQAILDAAPLNRREDILAAERGYPHRELELLEAAALGAADSIPKAKA